MQRNERDAAYLWDMLQASQDILAIMQGVSLASFQESKQTRLAVERAFEIMGEAARRVSPELQAQNPDIPWRAIVGQRNVLAHEYADVDVALVWRTAVEEVPKLISQLKSLLPG